MVSCSNCREAHTACSDERPCARCVNIGKAHSCVDAVSRKRGRRPRTALTPPAGQQADPQQPQQQQLSLSSPTMRSPTFALPSASTFTSIATPGGQQDSRSSFGSSPFFIAAPIPTQLSYSCSPSPLASPAGKGGGSGGTSSDGTGGSRRAPGPALSFRPTYFGPSPSPASSALALSSASSSAVNKQQGHKAKHKRTRNNPTGGGRKEIFNTEDGFDVSNDDPSTTGTKPRPEQNRHESYSSNPEGQQKVAKVVSTFEQHPPRQHNNANKQNDPSGEVDSLYPHHQMHLPPHSHSHTTKQHASRPQHQHRVRQQQPQGPTPCGKMDPERERQNFVASLMLRFNAALKENSDALASRMERKVQESKREVELLREELRELKNLLLSTAAVSAAATSSSSSASSRHHHMAHDLGMDPPRSGNTSLKVSFGPSSIASSSSLSSSNRRNESYWNSHFDEMEIMGSSGTSAFSSLFSSTDREEPLSPRPLFSSIAPSFWPATPPNSDFGGAALPPISSASCPSSSSSFASSSSSSSLPHHHSDISYSSSSSSQPPIDLCSFLCSNLSTCSPFLPSAGSTSSSASASFSTSSSSSSFSSTTSSSSDQLANMGEAFGRIPSHMQKPFLMMVHSVGVSKIVNVNDSYCKLLKINPEDLVGQPSFILRSFLPPQHRFMVDPEIIPLFERHTTFYDCYRAIILAQARDGSHLQMDSAYHTFYGVTGLPSWTILIVEGVKLLTGSIQGIPPSIVLIRPKSCNSSNSLPSISWQPQRQQEGERDGDGEDGEGDGESSSSSSQDQRHQRQHHHGHLESILQSDDYSSQTDLVGNNVSNPNVVSSSSTSPISTSPLNLQQQSTSFSSSPTSSSTSSCPTSPSFVFPSQLSSMSAATSSSSSSCSSSASTSSSTSTLASAASQQHACKEGALETDMTSSSTNNDTNHNQSLPSSHSRGTRDPSSSSPSSSSPPPSSSSSPSSSGFNHQNPQRLFFSQQHTSITSSSIEDIINKQLRSASASISSVSSSSASFMVGGQEAGGATPPAGSCASCTTPIPNSPEPFSIFYQL